MQAKTEAKNRQKKDEKKHKKNLTITEKKLTLFIIIEGVSKQRCSNEMRLRGNKQASDVLDKARRIFILTIPESLTDSSLRCAYIT